MLYYHVISFVVKSGSTHRDSRMLHSTYSMLSQRCNADDPQEQGGIWCDVAAGCCSAKGARVSRLEISTVHYCNHSWSYVLSPDFVVRFQFSIELKNMKAIYCNRFVANKRLRYKQSPRHTQHHSPHFCSGNCRMGSFLWDPQNIERL